MNTAGQFNDKRLPGHDYNEPGTYHLLLDIAETRAHVQLVRELYWALLQDRQARRATGMKLQPAR